MWLLLAAEIELRVPSGLSIFVASINNCVSLQQISQHDSLERTERFRRHIDSNNYMAGASCTSSIWIHVRL